MSKYILISVIMFLVVLGWIGLIISKLIKTDEEVNEEKREHI